MLDAPLVCWRLALLSVLLLALASGDLAFAQAPAEVDATARVEHVVRGRVVDSDGLPVHGSMVRLVGVMGWPEAIGREDIPSGPVSTLLGRVFAFSDKDGNYELAFDAPVDVEFGVAVTSPALGGARRRWLTTKPGEPLELGATALLSMGGVTIRVLDSEGDLRIGEQWEFECVNLETGQSHGCRAWPLLGGAEVLPLPPGAYEVRGATPTNQHTVPLRVDVRSFEVTQCSVVFDGAVGLREIGVSVSMSIAGEGDSRIQVRLLGGTPEEVRTRAGTFLSLPMLMISLDPGWHRAELLASPFGPQRQSSGPTFGPPIEFQNLTPGSYRAEIDDPRFDRVVSDLLEFGETPQLTLHGASDLELRVFDASGGLLSDYSVTLVEKGGGPPERAMRLSLEESSVPSALGGKVFKELPSAHFTLYIWRRGEPTWGLDLDPLERGETRRLDVVIPEPTTITGVVRDELGASVGGALVQLIAPGLTAETEMFIRWGFGAIMDAAPRPERSSAVTDLNGTFQLRAFLTQPLSVVAGHNGFFSEPVELLQEPVPASLQPELLLPRQGTVTGRVSGLPQSIGSAVLHVSAIPTSLSRTRVAGHQLGARVVAIEPDGVFSLELAPGTWKLSLLRSRTSRFGVFKPESFEFKDGTVTIISGATAQADLDAPALDGKK